MLTPLEIENKKFPTKFRGYDDVEVDTFLDQIIIDYEKLYKESLFSLTYFIFLAIGSYFS